MNNVRSTVIAVGVGATYDIQPPAGEEWEVSDLSATLWGGVPPASVPDMTIGLFNGALGPALFRNSLAAAANVRGWAQKPQWYIDNTNYLRVTPNAAGDNIGFSAQLLRLVGPAVPTTVVSGMEVLIAGATRIIRPPAGQEWVITDIGSTRWVGMAPAGLPNVTVQITDGAQVATIMDGPNTRAWDKNLEIHINNTNYLLLTNPVGAGATVSWSGLITRDWGAATPTNVKTVIATVGAGGVMTVRPPVGEEWKVTEIAALTWTFGPAPAQLPDVSVALTNGVVAPILLLGTDNKGWFEDMAIYIDNTTYLTLTDTTGAGNTIAVSALKTAQYQ